MATQNIAQNLRDNNTNWQNVKQAIEDKGISTYGLTTAQYANAISQIPSGSEPVLDTLNVTPSTVSQTITPPSGTDGYDEVNVDAVDNTIDANIVAGNIRKDVSILGIIGTYEGSSGTYQSKTVTPSTSQQTVTPDSGYDALSQVTVDGDVDLVAVNIKNGVSIFGVQGSYSPSPTLQTKSVTPTTSAQQITADSGYDGLDEVDVAAVTASIDSNIVAGNIKKDVVILGVTGTYEGGSGEINYYVPEAFTEAKAYSDSSPVTYEWILDSMVDNINISDNGGHVYYQPTTSNTVVSVKRSSTGEYETLTPDVDFTLTVTGSSTANYSYNIDIPCNDYIYAVKVVYTQVYRVNGTLKCNKLAKATYSTEEPSSTTGFETGEYWIVIDSTGAILSQYRFNGTAWTEVTSGGSVIYSTVENAGSNPQSLFEETLAQWNDKLCVISKSAVYAYDESTKTFTQLFSGSNIVADAYTAAYLSVVVGEHVYYVTSGVIYDYNLYTQTRSTLVNGSGTIGGCYCVTSDGTYIYVADVTNSTIWKVEISTGTITALATNVTRVPTQMIYRRGYIYGTLGEYIDKVDVSDGTITNVLNTGTSTNADFKRCLVADSDYIYGIGGNGTGKSNQVIKIASDDTYQAITISKHFRQAMACIYHGDLYCINYNQYWRDTQFSKLGEGLNKDFIVGGTDVGDIDTNNIKRITVI